MKSLLNIIKTEKKNKNKNIDKTTQFEIQLVEIKYANNPNKIEHEKIKE